MTNYEGMSVRDLKGALVGARKDAEKKQEALNAAQNKVRVIEGELVTREERKRIKAAEKAGG